MASRIFAADQPGRRYEFTTRRVSGADDLHMAIAATHASPVVAFVLESHLLKRIRMSFQPLELNDNVVVRYLVASVHGVTRAGFRFEFADGSEFISVFVPADGMEWLAGNPDSDAFQPRASLQPWETGILPC